MGNNFEIHKSNKHGFGNQENHLITKGKTSYLRIVGNYPNYSIMTATASEDDKNFYVCNDKFKLLTSAIQLGLEWGTPFYIDKDRSDREFIWICCFNFILGEEHKDCDELGCFIDRFFEIFDASACQEQNP